MLIDGRQLAPDTTLQADVCIVGTGMGAISAAHPLVRAGRDVLFVETGPMAASRRDPPSVRIESVGRPFGISTSRGLEVGGGTAFWHGVCAPLDDEDFVARPWIAHSGWAIARGDLDPWYAVALDFLCGGQDMPPDTAGHHGGMALGMGNMLASKPYRYRSPPFRGKPILREWCRNGMARCVYNGTALQLRQRHGRTHVLVVGSGAHRIEVRANRFVIAAGALETPRLLLNSLGQHGMAQPPSWWLGRNLIDHPAGYLSQVTFRQPLANKPKPPRGTGREDIQVFPGLMLRRDFQKTHRLPNHAVFIRKGINRRPVPNKAVMSFLGVRGPRDIGLSHVASLVRHPYILWRIAHQKLPLGLPSHHGDLFFMTEQLPNPHSQVSLSEHERDRYGMPIARVHWQLGKQDIEMFTQYHDLLMAGFRGHGDVSGCRADPVTLWRDTCASAAHHLGTARMGTTPTHGVVDANLKVFGFENVWVSDGSVFPTAGSVNPSLTICALGQRLGSHLNALR
jgi:choline dehydrogenase-like flavoprotein